jgi:cell division protein FtsL
MSAARQVMIIMILVCFFLVKFLSITQQQEAAETNIKQTKLNRFLSDINATTSRQR